MRGRLSFDLVFLVDCSVSVCHAHVYALLVKSDTLFSANAAVLSAVGYYSYLNWDKPKWDRRVVSAVSVGLLTLFGGEG